MATRWSDQRKRRFRLIPYQDVADLRAVFYVRYGNVPTNFHLTGEQISSEDNFRAGDDPAGIYK
jgi:hypothetical protein